MGNSQSNTRTYDYKKYKIVGLNDNSDDYTRCHLDDYVPYKDGNYKHMDFKNDTVGETLDFFTGIMGGPQQVAALGVGLSIKIDTNWTHENYSYENFSKRNVSNVIQLERDYSFLEGLGELGYENFETRQRYAAAIEQTRFERQIREWHYEPPKK